MEEEAAAGSDAAAMLATREELSVGEIDPNDVVFAAHFEMQQRVAAATADRKHEQLDESRRDEQQQQQFDDQDHGDERHGEDDDAWRFGADLDHTYAQHERRQYGAVETAAVAAEAYYGDYDDEYDDGDDEGDDDDDLVHSSWSTEKEQLAHRFGALETRDVHEDAVHASEDSGGHGSRYDHEAATNGGDGSAYDAAYRRLAFLNGAFSDDNDNNDGRSSSNGDDHAPSDSATDDDELLEFHAFIHATRQHARRLAAPTEHSDAQYDDYHGLYGHADERVSQDDGSQDASRDASRHVDEQSARDAETAQQSDPSASKDDATERLEQNQQQQEHRQVAGRDSGHDERRHSDAADHEMSDDHAYALNTSRMSEPQQQARGFQHSHFTLSAFSTATTADGADDEWQEAYTAKGRVYYYNRRTRESSWKRPDNFVSRDDALKSQAFASSLASSHGVDAAQLHRVSAGRAAHSSSSRSSLAAVDPESQDFLFCAFCGTKTVGVHATQTHATDCRALAYHRSHATPVYRQFEALLSHLADDASLRSLHYAASFPDAKPLAISPTALAAYAATESEAAPIQSSLYLLRRRWHAQHAPHRSDRDRATRARDNQVSSHERPARRRESSPLAVARPSQHQQQLSHRRERLTSEHSVESTTSSTASSARRRASAPSTADAPGRPSHQQQQQQRLMTRQPSASSSSSHGSSSNATVYRESETCRYCGRSFAEGRLAKHEGVCLRVFGSEGSWGRGAASPGAATTPRPRPGRLASGPATAVRSASKSPKPTKRNLALSYKEYQATLVRCPVCARTFAPSGAQQHIAICKSVQNRPKNPLRHVRGTADAAFAAAG